MSLSLSLNTALSGLKVNQESLSVLSQNIANANNPDYSRKIISQSAVELNGVGAGVSIDDITRKIDSYLQQATRTQTSVAGRDGVLSDYAERLQILLGSPGAGNGMNSYISNMFNAMQALAETPERSSNRVNVVNAAKNLVNEFQHLYDGLQDLRFDADQEIKTSISTVNLRLSELYDINTAIASATVLNRPKSELLDKRDAAIREIAQHLDINIFVREDESVNIYARGGAAILDNNLYQLEYRPISSPDALRIEDPQFSPIRSFLVDSSTGERISESIPIAQGGTAEEAITAMSKGRVRGLMDVRNDKLTSVLEQIDNLAGALRDQINALHNAGSGYPGLNSMTGTRPITPQGFSNWTGSVRLGLVDQNGQPIDSPFANETTPMRPLTIDLSTLDAGLGKGPGYPTPQAIVNEINSFYGTPRNRTSLGNINNIELSSASVRLPSGFLNFDFDLENISGADAQFFVTSISVLDDTATDITSVTNTVPSVALNALNTYSTTANSNLVSIAATAHGMTEGDYVYLPTPSSGVGNIPAVQLGGIFKIVSTAADSFEIETVSQASSSAMLSEAGTAIPKYYDSTTGTKERTTANGQFAADLSGNISSMYYDVRASVAIVNADGTTGTSTITYRVANNDGNMFNKRYGASSATGSATVEIPNQRTQTYATAKLVDANGDEIGKVNGQYFADVESFLKLETSSGSYYLSIDSLDSSENGDPSGNPFVVPGSGRGFSHFFELNNFFTSNVPTNTGDTVLNSARNLQLESHIANNPENVSTGKLVRGLQSSNPNDPPNYSYERISGDDSAIQQLADLASELVSFGAAGGLSAATQTLSGYAGEILGFAGADANTMESNFSSTTIILQGFTERSQAISGVNLDEELANTIIYQNAYSASARVITVTNELFETLLSSF